MKTFTMVRRNPDTQEPEEIVAHQCPCGNIVECCIDGGERHWIHCTCGETTNCGKGVMDNRVSVGINPKAQCGNCEKTWDEGDLHDIVDFSLRTAPGEEIPAGQCPDCQALCHRVKPEVEEPKSTYALADGDLNILVSPAYGYMLPGQMLIGDLEVAKEAAEAQSYLDGVTPNIVKITLVVAGD
jgi:hypothetical protein